MTAEMEARELDALVAELIMGYGWRVAEPRVINGEALGPPTRYLCAPGLFPAVPLWDGQRECEVVPFDCYPHTSTLPLFSTSISAAWSVVEHLATMPGKYDAEGRATNGYFGAWFNDACLFALTAKEAALGICRAALLAVEKEAKA